MIDVLLVMPPVSEAVQFPYLALPQLTAAWTARGHTVRALDLNLEYRDEVLVCRGPAREQPDDAPARSAGDIYRSVSERYRSDHGALLLSTARDRSTGFAQETAIQATGRYVAQQAARDGWVISGTPRLGQLDKLVEAARDTWSARWCTARLEAVLEEERPRVLAFSVPFFSQVVPTLVLTTLLKQRRPDLRIALGGPTVQMWAALLLRRTEAARSVDHWCVGHGEDFLADILPPGSAGSAASVRQPTPLPAPAAEGLRDAFVLNDQPMPDFGQFDFADYSNQAHQFPYRLTVGCYWGRCTFCSYGNRYRDARAFQQIHPDTAADHLIALSERLGITDVAVADENTGLRHLLRVMEAVRRRGAELTFRVRARLEPELADPGFCRRLRESGCVQLSTGFETARQEILDSLGKGQDAAHAERAVLNLTRAGIVTNLSFMDGYAHPNAVDGYHDTVGVIQRHPAELGLDTMQLLVAEPGSYLWAQRERPDDEPLVTNDGLAFAAGRVGGAVLDDTATEAARQRLLRMTVEAVPDAERAGRPDLPHRGGEPPSEDRAAHRRSAPGPAPAARPRFAVALEQVGGRWFLADVAWPRMAAVPPDLAPDRDGRFTADAPATRRWLHRMLDKRLLVPDPSAPDALEGRSA
ncbi:B12-binding domain-containing radical SAM protein [Streptomyces griseorubiginosus]|uniref:B12-binding domain-containing radical SAM protein n=1 Tax=Streptomyces griseorubiginosus TaxID=67304 RepID=UPI0036E373FD